MNRTSGGSRRKVRPKSDPNGFCHSVCCRGWEAWKLPSVNPSEATYVRFVQFCFVFLVSFRKLGASGVTEARQQIGVCEKKEKAVKLCNYSSTGPNYSHLAASLQESGAVGSVQRGETLIDIFQWKFPRILFFPLSIPLCTVYTVRKPVGTFLLDVNRRQRSPPPIFLAQVVRSADLPFPCANTSPRRLLFTVKQRSSHQSPAWSEYSSMGRLRTVPLSF